MMSASRSWMLIGFGVDWLRFETPGALNAAYALAATLATLCSNARMAQQIMSINENAGVHALLQLLQKETEQEWPGMMLACPAQRTPGRGGRGRTTLL